MNGRVSNKFGKHEIPYKEIFNETIKKELKRALPHLDVDNWVKIIYETSSSSRNPRWFAPESLDDLPEIKNVYANDTSAVIGNFPFTSVEKLALLLEGYFYDLQGKPKFDFIGHDIKVMLIRNNNNLNITMCVPFITTHTPNYDFYCFQKKKFTRELKEIAVAEFNPGTNVIININSQDDLIEGNKQKFIAGHYCNLAGSALDYGEEGVVGRGNNRRGIIPSFRSYTMEAAWGKNPVYHVGKVLGVVVDELAKEIAFEVGGSVQIAAITKLGDPLFAPNSLNVQTSGNFERKVIEKIVNRVLGRRDWTERILAEQLLVPKVYQMMDK